MKTRNRILLGAAAGLVLAALLLAFLPFNPPQWTASEVRERVALLNQKAGIDTPHHDLGPKIRDAHLALFEKVERGQPLSFDESARYRVLYQSILERKQHELALLDDQLTVLTDYRPDEANNVGTRGIAGSHDHHDASSGANLAALREDLAQLERARGATASFSRVRAALRAYKDLDDIILHMATAPHTKSVPRISEAPVDELQSLYESMMVNFKRAQFEPVNSPEYFAHVERALDGYATIVLRVQERIYAQLGPTERSLSGRWSTWKSLAPSLRGVAPIRIPATAVASL